jgi:hypothetical protein
MVCDFTASPGGNAASTADVMPDTGATTVPQITGPTGQTYANTAAAQNSTFRTLGFWAKCAVRVDGKPYGSYRIDLGTDNTFANRMLSNITLKADGVWHFYVIHSAAFGTSGTFTIGTTQFNAVRFFENGGGTTRPACNAADKAQFGPVYLTPRGKAFAFVRFDDGTADQYTPRITLSTPYVGNSGVTIPSGVPLSGLSIVQAFGLKATCYVLTSCVGKAGNFMTLAQLLELQNTYGWCIAFQSAANPLDLNNAGLRLLGPYGYDLKTNVYTSIASVDTSANTITTTAAHKITRVTGTAGVQGYPVEVYGTNLPAPLQTGTKYWLRETTTTAFQLHPTEADANANTNAIDLTTTGTVGNFDYRYWGSANDGTAIAADFTAGQAQMQAWGLSGWRHYAPNQGAYDTYTFNRPRGH